VLVGAVEGVVDVDGPQVCGGALIDRPGLQVVCSDILNDFSFWNSRW
jgi:hypothetical protein